MDMEAAAADDDGLQAGKGVNAGKGATEGGKKAARGGGGNLKMVVLVEAEALAGGLEKPPPGLDA